MFLWDHKFVDYSTHEIHEIKCQANKKIAQYIKYFYSELMFFWDHKCVDCISLKIHKNKYPRIKMISQ